MNYKKDTKLHFCRGSEQISEGKLKGFAFNSFTYFEDCNHERSQQTLR